MIHFANLTRGLLCPHLDGLGAVRYCRIQSSHCESKYWPGIIYGAGPEMLVMLAAGETVVVHDVSERDRETRAMWQGLTFLRRTCETLWHLPLTPVTGRGGVALADYLDGVIGLLDKNVRAYVRYYGRRAHPYRVNLLSCWHAPLSPDPCELTDWHSSANMS